MPKSNSVQRYSLLCLRLESECRGVAAGVPDPALRAHFLRMAGTWSELAAQACLTARLPRQSSVAGGAERESEAGLRYFFDITDGTSMFKDDQGQTFPTSEDAKAAASRVAAVLAADCETYRSFEIQVTDEAGNDVARVPISEQARSA